MLTVVSEIACFRQLHPQHTIHPVMAITRGVILTAVAMAFVSFAAAHLRADVCVYKPLKVRRICGVIVDPDGAAVPGVEVTIFKDANAVAASKTTNTGEFNFHVMESGKYDLDVMAPGFQHARYSLTLLRPNSSCRNALRVEMDVGSIHCKGDAIRETRKPLGQK
jgi:carboxypeptidase family protein